MDIDDKGFRHVLDGQLHVDVRIVAVVYTKGQFIYIPGHTAVSIIFVLEEQILHQRFVGFLVDEGLKVTQVAGSDHQDVPWTKHLVEHHLIERVVRFKVRGRAEAPVHHTGLAGCIGSIEQFLQL